MVKEKLVNGYPFVAYKCEAYDATELIKRSADYLKKMDKRRSVRHFSTKAVPREVIENIVLTASTAPSGMHMQPWTFCLVSDPGVKKEIRNAIEKEESHNADADKQWANDMLPLRADADKSYIQDAPWVIVVFEHQHNDGNKNYRIPQSIGIATGLLVAAIHNTGLAALTYAPDTDTLQAILGRPANEKPYMIIPVGYAADDCYVPKLIRKGMKDIAVFYEDL